MTTKKITNSDSERQLEKAEEQFEKFDEQVKSLTMDRMNLVPKLETEQQTKMAGKDIDKNNGHYLKPAKTVGSVEKFNEKFRENYNFDKEYVNFIAENKEIIGDQLEMWTKPYPGCHAEFWRIPVNKPVWGPRYLAEQIKRKFYHRLKSENRPTGQGEGGEYYGTMVVDTTIARLDAYPVSTKRSLFMGSTTF
jgi:hypothetical protein